MIMAQIMQTVEKMNKRHKKVMARLEEAKMQKLQAIENGKDGPESSAKLKPAGIYMLEGMDSPGGDTSDRACGSLKEALGFAKQWVT